MMEDNNTYYKIHLDEAVKKEIKSLAVRLEKTKIAPAIELYNQGSYEHLISFLKEKSELLPLFIKYAEKPLPKEIEDWYRLQTL